PMNASFRTIVLALAALAPAASVSAASIPNAPVPGPSFKTADIGGGITLHYAQEGTGAPLIFVHGSISDYGYWEDQIGPFSKHYRAIAYSRRYNYPNSNPSRAGYSAVTDADDLAAFIKKLHLGKVYLIGHSYGALTALFFASRHPELVRAVVLAEAPAVPLLRDLPGNRAREGVNEANDIDRRMIAPMKAAFRRGRTELGVATFVDYVYGDPNAWAKMSASSRAQTMRDAHEWDVMLTSGTLFPPITPQEVEKVTMPVMVLSGDKSYHFLTLIDQELASLLPENVHVIVHGAGHQMWYQQPAICRGLVEAFFEQTAQ
ncbi:MAG: alpha/beta hydrolase, partial [Candidatus Baltobacteraceae bacterium]